MRKHKMSKISTLLIAALSLFAFGFSGCNQSAKEIIDDIMGDSTVKNLAGQLTVGTYTGTLSNVEAVAGNTTVTLSWTNPTDDAFQGVNIYKNTDTTPVFQGSKTDTYAVIKNLTNGTEYTFTLFPVGKESDGSNKVGKNPSYKVIAPDKTAVDKTYVGEITNLTWTVDEGKITFKWTNPTEENFAGVKIYVKDELYATTTKAETSVVVAALTNGETYSFTFKALGLDADGVKKDSLNVIQKRIKLDEINLEDYFGELTEIKHTPGDGSVTFTWKNPEDENFAGVAVYVDDVKKDDVEKTVTTYTFENLNAGSYTFKLVAKGKNRKGVIVETKNPTSKKVDIIKLVEYGFIGRGYNAVSGEYFSAQAGGLKDQVLQFSNTYKPTVDDRVSASDVKFSAGTTLSSYQKEFTQSVGIEGGYGGFSASVDVNFSSSEAYSEETSFASANAMNKKAREYLTASQKELSVLKENLSEDFKKAINDSTVSADKIFKDYGTHVLLDTYVGGRFAINYTYKNTERESAQSISVAVKANYEGAFSAGGSSSTGYGTNSKMSSSNTSISGYSRGGKSIAFASMDQAVECWKEWTDSLEDSATWSLIDSPDTINDQNTNTGIWLFADDTARQEEIKAAYLKLLEKNSDSFAAKQTCKWVKSVTFYDNGNGSAGDYASVRKSVKAILGHDNFSIAGENSAEKGGIGTYDLLNGCGSGGNYVYLIMEYTTNKAEALRGVIGNSSESAASTENVTLRNPTVTKSLWTEMKGLNTSGGNYRNGKKTYKGYKDDGYRVLFNSKTQNREGTTGDKAYCIKEVAVYNATDKTSSASSAAIKGWKYNGDGNNITTETGGDDIFLRLYYDPTEQ